MVERERGRDRTGERVRYDDRALDSEVTEHLVHHRSLARRRCAVVGPSLTPTVAGPVDQDDAMLARELIAERDLHVAEVAARAVQ